MNRLQRVCVMGENARALTYAYNPNSKPYIFCGVWLTFSLICSHRWVNEMHRMLAFEIFHAIAHPFTILLLLCHAEKMSVWFCVWAKLPHHLANHWNWTWKQTIECDAYANGVHRKNWMILLGFSIKWRTKSRNIVQSDGSIY